MCSELGTGVPMQLADSIKRGKGVIMKQDVICAGAGRTMICGPARVNSLTARVKEAVRR